MLSDTIHQVDLPPKVVKNVGESNQEDIYHGGGEEGVGVGGGRVDARGGGVGGTNLSSRYRGVYLSGNMLRYIYKMYHILW